MVAVLLITLGALGCDATEGSSPRPRSEAPRDPARSYDLLIHGGTLVDGTGTAAQRADVLVVDGAVAYVGVVDPDTLEVSERFDASDLIVTPGFVDAHAHWDPLGGGDSSGFLAQGVTTVVLGQDGRSPEAGGLGSHVDAVDAARPPINAAYLVGHNTLRAEAGVGFAAPSPEHSARMVGLLEAGLRAGAFGLSTGLEYDPGRGADLEELVALARPVAERGGVVMSHLRSEDPEEVEASVDELLAQGGRSGARVHVSHLKIVTGDDTGQARRILSRMQAARDEGTEVTADLYPYLASFTGTAILFPDWARPPADYGAVARDRRDELLTHLRERVRERNGPGAMRFTSGPWAGRTLEEAAREAGRPFEEILLEIGPGGAYAAYFVMDEEVMLTFLRDPHVAVASDGGPGIGHPRSYGTFARVIRRWVVEEEVMVLEEAVRKMSALPASIVGVDRALEGLLPRGRLQEGWAADIAVFDPVEVADRADYNAPRRLAEGMRAVWVNGVSAWDAGSATEGPGGGRALRASSR